MATLPTVPGPFTDGTAPTMTQLQQLAYAVSFLSDRDVSPIWHFYQDSSESLTANSWNSITYNHNVIDSDGVHASGGVAQIVTQGYYAVEACIGLSVTSTGFSFIGAFLWTAGANNPHFTSGTTLRFGPRGCNGVNNNSSNTGCTPIDICPNVCYPGDTIQPQVYVTAALSLKANTNDSWNEGRFSANFTGAWIAEGS